MAKRQSIGDPYWIHGPLVFAPAALAERFARDYEQVAGVFEAMRDAELDTLLGPAIVELFGTSVLILPGGTPTHFVALGEGGVFVRPHRKLGRRKGESFEVPHELPSELEIGPDWQLFDSMSGAEGEHAAARAQARLDIPLAPGRYRVEHSTPAPLSQREYSAVRLLPAGASKPATVPVVRKQFPVDAAMRKLAKTLRFIETEGGPFVALPERALAKWRGIGDADDEDDYERACSARGFVLGEQEGLVLAEPDSTAVLPTDEGVIFLRWVGADRGLDLLAALPHAKRWKKSKQTFKAKGPLVLFDAALDGRELGKRKRLEVPLRKGEYAIEWTEVEGEVEGGHEVMAGFVRLRRL